jgi:DNA-binding XRE family transcriptional regulator
LSSRSGISKGTLCDIENNKSDPKLSTVHKIAHGFNITIEELLRLNKNEDLALAILTEICSENGLIMEELDQFELVGNIWNQLDENHNFVSIEINRCTYKAEVTNTIKIKGGVNND